jgi:hypothetical protein
LIFSRLENSRVSGRRGEGEAARETKAGLGMDSGAGEKMKAGLLSLADDAAGGAMRKARAAAEGVVDWSDGPKAWHPASRSKRNERRGRSRCFSGDFMMWS